MENVDGDEHYEGPAVDEGRHSNAQDARPRESENECDRAQTEAGVGATQLKAMRLGVTLGGGRRKKGLKAPRR
jgi:hypothetical protein